MTSINILKSEITYFEKLVLDKVVYQEFSVDQEKSQDSHSESTQTNDSLSGFFEKLNQEDVLVSNSRKSERKKRVYSQIDSLQANANNQIYKAHKLEEKNENEREDGEVSLDEDLCSEDSDFEPIFEDAQQRLKLLDELINELAKSDKGNDCSDLSSPNRAPVVYSIANTQTISVAENQNEIVLTATLNSHRIVEDITADLRKNLSIARKIIQVVHKAIPFSDNYVQRSTIFTNKKIDSSLSASLRNVLEFSLLMRRANMKHLVHSSDELIEKIIDSKIGNCYELSRVGQWLGKKINASIEIVDIDGGNHAVLILGRDQTSKLENFDDWGSNAAVCDIWSGAYYPAFKLREHLMDLKGVVEMNGTQYTCVKKFDPSYQTLKQISDVCCSLKDDL